MAKASSAQPLSVASVVGTLLPVGFWVGKVNSNPATESLPYLLLEHPNHAVPSAVENLAVTAPSKVLSNASFQVALFAMVAVAVQKHLQTTTELVLVA